MGLIKLHILKQSRKYLIFGLTSVDVRPVVRLLVLSLASFLGRELPACWALLRLHRMNNDYLSVIIRFNSHFMLLRVGALYIGWVKLKLIKYLITNEITNGCALRKNIT